MRCALALTLLLVIVPLVRTQDAKDKKPKGPPMVDGLKALKHEDPKVRYRACQTLGQLGPLAKFAVEDLGKLLEDKHPLVRIKAAEALWKIGETPAATLLPVLLTSLKDKDAGVRAAVPPVIALMGPKAKNGVPALAEALKDKELDVKLSAVAALGDLGPVAKDRAGALLDLASDKDFFLLEPFVGAALSNLGEGAIPALSKAIGDKKAERRRLAIYALGSFGPKAAPAAGDLAKALTEEDPAIQTLAARALGKIGPAAKHTLPQLDKAVADKAADVRIESALAVWFIANDVRHVPVLVKALADDSPNVRINACHALAAMKAAAKDAVGPVAKLLDDKELRIRATMTLGDFGPASKGTLPVLKKMMTEKDDDARLASAFAVWQISGEAKESMKVLEDLLGTEKHYTQTIIVLGEMGPVAEGLLPTLVALWRVEEIASDRQALAVAIKKIDAKAALRLGIK